MSLPITWSWMTLSAYSLILYNIGEAILIVSYFSVNACQKKRAEAGSPHDSDGADSRDSSSQMNRIASSAV
jgi:hypothetical protein